MAYTGATFNGTFEFCCTVVQSKHQNKYNVFSVDDILQNSQRLHYTKWIKDEVVREYVKFRMIHDKVDEQRQKLINHLTEWLVKEYWNWWQSLNQKNAEAEEDAENSWMYVWGRNKLNFLYNGMQKNDEEEEKPITETKEQGIHDKFVASAVCSKLQRLTYLNSCFEQCTNYTSGFWFSVA